MKRFLQRKQKKPTGLNTPQNEYYENISARLGITQVILYLSLFAFVVLSFFRNTELITYQNFYYFIKDLNASSESVFAFESDAVSYPTDSEQSFTLYRKGLAVAGNSAVTVFTATGRQTVSQNISYRHPVAVGAGKYLLVYELGGTQYSLYNSYAQVFKGSSEQPILGAAVSDSGMYAIVSSSETYTSTVSLYSNDFSLLNRYNKVGYVMDVSINQKGTQVAILSSTPQNGVFSTELMLCEPGKNKEDAKDTVGDTFGWRCAYTSNGNIAVLHEKGVLYFADDGEELSSFSFSGRTPAAVDMSADGVSVCLTSNAFFEENSIIVFDKSGKMLYNEDVSDNAQQIARSGNSLYWLSEDGIHRLNLKNKEISFSECDVSKKKLLAPSEAEALICSPQKAEYINFDS